MQQIKKKDVVSCLDQTNQRTIGSHNSMGAHAEPKKNRTQKTKEIQILNWELGWVGWLTGLGTLVQGQSGKKKT